MLGAIERRNEKRGESQEVTPLFATIATLEAFHMTPREWATLPGIDRKALMYYRVLKNHHAETDRIEQEKAAERDRARRDFMSSLPAQARRR